MTRYSPDRKPIAEECPRISTSLLRKHGYFLKAAKGGSLTWVVDSIKSSIDIIVSTVKDREFLELIYSKAGSLQKDQFDYKIRLLSTPCNYGGVRYWFSCLLCEARVSSLYLPPSACYFACRHCYNLSYESRNTSISKGRFRALEILCRLDEYEKKIKRKYYAGRETKKYLRYLKLVRLLS